MNRSEIVSLLQRNIEELVLITNGFAQMETYPDAILDLARRKNADISGYIEMLAGAEVMAQDQAQAQEKVEDQAQAKEKAKEEEEVDVQQQAQVEEEEKAQVEEVAEKESDDEEQEDIQEEAEETEVEVETETEQVENHEVEEVIVATVDEAVTEEEEKTTIGIEIIHPIEIDDLDEINLSTEKDKKSEQESHKPVTLGEKLSGNHVSRNDILNKPTNGGMHSSISNLKISDIRQAISLGDRFRFQRELFRNNGEEMNKMLSYLNMLATYEEAVAFLFSKYGWDEENPAVNDFLQIIKRKF